MARDLAAELPVGTLLVADLAYFGFAWFDWLTDRSYHWLSRLRAKTSYEVVHVFHQRGEVFDGIVWLGAYRADRAKHAVRLVTFRQGRTMRRYITNVRDPHTFPIVAEVELAGGISRWRSNWSSGCTFCGLPASQQLIISQVLQALRLEVAQGWG